MKHLLYILLLTGLVSCVDKVNYTSTKSFCVVDSVEYHGVGQDNSLQTTPYWNVHVKDSSLWIRSYYPYKKGDTVTFVNYTYKK